MALSMAGGMTSSPRASSAARCTLIASRERAHLGLTTDWTVAGNDRRRETDDRVEHVGPRAGITLERERRDTEEAEVARTSPRLTAGRGRSVEASTTAVLPFASTGARTLTRPSRLDSWGANTPTTPLGSGRLKLKYGPE